MQENRKLRILFVSESSYLFSGFAVYYNNIIKRLHATNKYNICELGCGGSFSDPRQFQIPWDFVSNCPKDDEEDKIYKQSFALQSGEFKFEQVCLDFKPDIVFDCRDFWYLEHIERSPFRPLFHAIYMPTVDGDPQNVEWLDTYKRADAIFTYTDWGLDLLNKQGNGSINTICSTPPGADLEIFKPLDKDALRLSLGLKIDDFIIGTTMRNQGRKLYPDLIEAFSKIVENGPDNIYLYLHCSFPDQGWNLPKLIADFGVGSRTLFTYKCKKCNTAFPSLFRDAITNCPSCKTRTCKFTDVSDGVESSVLAKIYNLFSVFSQYSTREGFGMPQVEAAACEVPVLAVDYSAMADIVRKLNGFPIKVQRYFKELSMDAYGALPDNNDFIQKVYDIYDMPASLRQRLGFNARAGVLEHYTYEKTVAKLEKYFDTVQPKNLWDSPKKIFKPNTNIPDNLTNEEFVRWCIINIAGRSDLVNSYMACRVIKDLNWGCHSEGLGGMIFNDMSAFNSQLATKKSYNRQMAAEQFLMISNKYNNWEEKRCQK